MRRLMIFIIAVTLIYGSIYTTVDASVDSMTIQDKTKTGYKVNVDKVGTEYGLQTIRIGNKYMICNKDDDATPYYYGFEAADGSWMILKWTVSAGADVFAYDSGASAYSTAWTGRVSLTYQSYGSEF